MGKTEKELKKEYYLRNRDRVLVKAKKYYEENGEKVRQYQREYNKKNNEKIKEKRKLYREKNKNTLSVLNIAWKKKHKKEVSAKNKEYRLLHLEDRRNWHKNRYKTNLQYKMMNILRKRLGNILYQNTKSGSALHDLGCSLEELKTYIEKQFTNGMTWENWSKYGWHIDHIIPLSSFDLSDREQFKKAVHYTNLQPLWWNENLSKGARLNYKKTHAVDHVPENYKQQTINH
jgi:hypothetical protein